VKGSRVGSERITVAVIGTGYFGSGLLRRLVSLDAFAPRIAANRTVERAVAAFGRSGIAADRVIVTDDVVRAQAAIDDALYVATSNLRLPSELGGIDIVVEATGDLLIGADVAVRTIRGGKHFLAANSDVQATIGPILKHAADRAGVIYSDIDGDEPGLLKKLYDDCVDMGLEVVLAGNGKGVLKRYATPATQAAFAAAHGLQPWLATAAADGTKLNFELTVFANATGFSPAVPGMYGPATGLDHAVEEYLRLGLLDGGHHIDYVLGGRGVFVVVKSEDPEVLSDFRYLKLGDGPYYVFHRPDVLIHYQATRSIVRAVRLGEATVAPLGKPVAETVAFAKRDLIAGQFLDGVGGFDTYGLVMRADEAASEGLLPIGLAQFARLRRSIRRDQPLPVDAVEFEVDNLALELRREQDRFYATGLSATAVVAE
jgi:predicted homoserine dehydrogenase-like protein